MAHNTHRLIIGIVSFVDVDGLFLTITLIVMLIIGVISVILMFVRIVIGVLVAPSERKGAGSTWCLDDSFVGFAIKVCVVSDVAVDHGK